MPNLKDPYFSFTRRGSSVQVHFNNHPLKDAENKERWFTFQKECNSDLEAYYMLEHLQGFLHAIRKEAFTEGFEAHKKRQPNYYK